MMAFQGMDHTPSRHALRSGSDVNELRDMAEEDKEEGMDRMENDGAGVVPENTAENKLVMRNDLTDTKNPETGS